MSDRTDGKSSQNLHMEEYRELVDLIEEELGWKVLLGKNMSNIKGQLSVELFLYLDSEGADRDV